MFQGDAQRYFTGLRLFCIPHAGGAASAFRGWRSRLLPEIEAISVQLPGRESRLREPLLTTMEEVVQDLMRAIRPWIAEGRPFAFFGSSLGALIAFETAHAIRCTSGREPAHLFVSAAGAPHCEPPLPPIAHLEDGPFLDEVQRRYAGIPDVLLKDPGYRSILLPALRADFSLMEQYEPRPPAPLSCPITAFAGRFDATVALEAVDAWRSQTTARFERVDLDEGHLYLESAQAILIRRIRHELLSPVSPFSETDTLLHSQTSTDKPLERLPLAAARLPGRARFGG